MTTVGSLTFGTPGNGLPPPLLSLNGPTGIPPFKNPNPSQVQTIEAGFVSLVQPTNASLQISSALTNRAAPVVQPTAYTRQYSPEIYAVVFNGLTEGQSTRDTLDGRTRAQQTQILQSLLNPAPPASAPVAVPPAQPVAPAPNTSVTPANAASAVPAPAPPPPPPPAPPPAPGNSSAAPSQAAATVSQITAGTPAPSTPAQHAAGLVSSGS